MLGILRLVSNTFTLNRDLKNLRDTRCNPRDSRVVCNLALVFVCLMLPVAGPAARAMHADTSGEIAQEILTTHCVACHNPEKKKGGLIVTSRETLLQGGENGAPVSPGKSRGRLFDVLLPGADPHMPPKGQLTETEIQSLRDWVQNGMVWSQRSNAATRLELDSSRLQPMPSSYRPVLGLALSPDARFLAVACGPDLSVFDVASPEYRQIGAGSAQRESIPALAWSPDQTWLASGGLRSVRFWKPEPFSVEREFVAGIIGLVTSIEFAPDGHSMVLADSLAGLSGTVRQIDPITGQSLKSWLAHADTILDMEFSPDGQHLATAGADHLIKIWDVASGTEQFRLEGHTAPIVAIGFNGDSSRLVSAGADKQLTVWELATREKIIALGPHSTALSGTTWSADGKSIIAATDAGAVWRYTDFKTHTGEQSSTSAQEKKLIELEEPVASLAMSRNGSIVAAGTHDGIVYLLDAQGRRLARLAPEASVPARVTATPRTTPPDASPSTSRKIRGSVRKSNSNLTAPAPTHESLPEGAVSLHSDLPEITLAGPGFHQVLLLHVKTADGFEIDVSTNVICSLAAGTPIELIRPGEIRAIAPGSGFVVARLGPLQTRIAVTVRPADNAGASFVRDVLPALSRAGCNAGACHAKPEGQNGFKLSVFSYDPKADHAKIVRDVRGRRVFPAAPEHSLLLQKPTATLPHEGGRRFEPGSETYQLLVRWIREGMLYQTQEEPELHRLVTFPATRRYHHAGSQQLCVQAYYSDGTVRDVTHLAAFASNDKEIATVDDRGRVTIGTLTGQGVVVARYAGLVADAHLIIPAERLLPAERYANWPTNDFIDALALGQFQQLGLFPSDRCSDATFLRRTKLDAVGLLPTPEEVRAFLADSTPNKRSKWIDRILQDPAYSDFWANKWADLLRPNPDRVGVKSVFQLDQWLRESFQKNQPYDEFVRDILLVEGTNHRNGPAVIYRDRREPADLTTLFSQLFLGTRLECARCHHHPNEKWGQEDFFQLAAYFAPLKQKGAGLSPPISAGTETFYFTPGGTVKHPVSGEVLKPRPPGGPLPILSANQDPRRALADWMTAPENPFFARAAVNRVWAALFGRGLVDPVDDFRISNPCVNPALLDALAVDFAGNRFDFKHLLRTIMESRLYQLSSIPNEFNMADTRNFSRSYRRRLPAEVLFDSVNEATGVPDTFSAVPPGSKAVQMWSYKIDSQFLDAFGRPNSSSDCPCERDTHLSVVQSLHLMNSRNLQSKLSHDKGRVRALSDSSRSPREIVTELYLAALSRPPEAEEIKTAVAAFSVEKATRQTAAEDVFWSLLNSPEFVLNH
ncbi:MAG: DUF1553 domain-containing protein [Pedosphaera sp.]|nr:DUF1553 domain-containing protein [Pedosphaera sp.]